VSETTKALEQLTTELEKVSPPTPRTPGVTRVQVIDTPATAFSTVKEVLVPMLKPVGTAVVVIVLVAFMLLRLPDLRERIIRLLGARNLHLTTEALDDAARRISRYLLMQLLVNSWTGGWVALGLWFIGVPNAVLWGVLTLLLRFIPYVGTLAAASMPFILSFAVFDDWTRPVMVLGLFALLDLFSYSVLEPWLYGTHTGLSPVALLLAAAFWTWVWGIAGLFLAIPLTVCVAVMGKYIPQMHFLYVLLGDQPVLEPHERLYQRLLGSGRDQADNLLHEVLRSKTVLEVCDAVVVPAIQLVELDYDRGSLRAPRRKAVLQHIGDWADERLDRALASQAQGRILRMGGFASVVCVPADDKADEVIAKLLAAALLEQGIDAAYRDVQSMEQDILAARGDGHLRAIVISALPPHAVSPARAVARRVGLTWAPDAAAGAAPPTTSPTIVGLWNDSGDLERARERLQPAGATQIVTSFAECLQTIQRGRGEGSWTALPDEVRAEAAVSQT
jgi:predicted PurR-regulated permease PerM